ncbi:phospholipase D-like domain-containing protein [Paenibacillus sp. Z6-24]
MKWPNKTKSTTIQPKPIKSISILMLSTIMLLSACSSNTANDESQAAAQDNGAVETNEKNSAADMEANQLVGSATVDSSNMDYAFTSQGQNAEQLVLQTINDARQSIDLSMYNLSRGSIVKALAKAAERGVQVRIISDQSKVNLEDLQKLLDANVPIRINTFDGKMHEKLMLVDGQTALVGSFNYTRASSEENDEVLLAIHDAALTGKWKEVFEKMWNNQERYRDWRGN